MMHILFICIWYLDLLYPEFDWKDNKSAVGPTPERAYVLRGKI